MEPSKHFDEKIKRAMEDFEPGDSPAGSWELFEKHMEAAAIADLDDLLKTRLGSFIPADQPADWDALERLIEAEEAAEIIENEVAIDSLAYEKLSNLQVPYQSRHWSLMARRLEEEFTLRGKIYRYKLAELTLLALLLLTIVRFMPYADDLLRPASKGQAARNDQDHPQKQPGQAAPFQDNPIQGNPILQPGLSANGGQATTAPGTPIAAAGPDVSTQILAAAKKENAAVGNAQTGGSSTGFAEKNQTATGSDNVATLPVLAFSLEAKEAFPFEKTAGENLQRSMLAIEKTKAAPSLLPVPAPAPKPGFAWEETLPALKGIELKVPRNLRFSIFTTSDINYVTTPSDRLNVFDTLVAVSPNRVFAGGYGGGILVSLKRQKWEAQVGGIYSFKRYIPNTPAFLFETLNYYVREDFNGIQLDILQAPLHVNYHFKDSGKWRFYGSAGLAGHFVTMSVYEIEYKRTPAFNLLEPPTGPDDTRSIREEKDFPVGLLDGGTLRENFYLTANAGVGVERYLSPKWVLFFQPNYQHYLMSNGVGTNNDKIYSMSFFLGTKFSLK